MEANDPRCGAIFGPRVMIGTIYGRPYITMLHTKYKSFGSCVFRDEYFFMYFPLLYTHIADKAQGAWPVRTPGTLLVGFKKRITLHCYTQNMKAIGFVVLDNILCVSHCR